MENIDINQAAKSLSELIKQAADGNGLVITKKGKPIAKLTAIAAEKQSRQFGSAKDLIKISDDFDEPLNEFQEYM
jgi:prevent-host-death family protein